MAILVKKGGKGSGNWGHAGRPGKVGGSAPNKASQPALFDFEDITSPFDELSINYGYDELARKRLLGTPLPPDGQDVQEVLARQFEWYAKMGGIDIRRIGDYSTPEYQKASSDMKKRIIKRLAEATGMQEAMVNAVIAEWAETSNQSIDSMFLQSIIEGAFNDTLGTFRSEWQWKLIDEEDTFGSLDIEGKYGGDTQAALAGEQVLFSYGNKYMAEKRAKDLIVAMYNETQRQLKDAGIDGVYLFRGIKSDGVVKNSVGDVVELTSNALESWTIKPSVARDFAADVELYDPGELGTDKTENDPKYYAVRDGIVVAQYIPRERILSTPFSGFGCLSEGEFTVLDMSPVYDGTVNAWEKYELDDKSRVVAAYTFSNGINEDANIMGENPYQE